METERIRKWLETTGVKQAALARKAGIEPTKLNKVLHGTRRLQISEEKEINRVMTEHDATLSRNRALPSPHNLADTDQLESNVRFAPDKAPDRTWLNKPMVPLMGTGMGGDDGSFDFNTGVIDHKPRPPKADSASLYCIYLEGDSMEPRMDAGDLLFADPSLKPVAGRDVVIQMRPKQEGDPIRAFVKQIVSINSEAVELRQFNPPRQWRVRRAEILHIHVILRNSEMY